MEDKSLLKKIYGEYMDDLRVKYLLEDNKSVTNRGPSTLQKATK